MIGPVQTKVELIQTFLVDYVVVNLTVWLHPLSIATFSFLLQFIMSRAAQAGDATGHESSSGLSVRACSKRSSPKSTAEC